MLDEGMMDHIVAQTILYAEQYVAMTTLRPYSRVHQWSKAEFTKNKLKKFLALVIVMGLVSYPNLEDHWSTSWPFASFSFSKVSACGERKCRVERFL